MNNQLIVVTSNFQSFIASLKSNLKLGYGVCESTEFLNGFFRAALVQGTDSVYVANLNAITGDEVENVIDLLSNLGDALAQQGTVKDSFGVDNTESVTSEVTVKQEIAVEIKKPVRKARKDKTN